MKALNVAGHIVWKPDLLAASLFVGLSLTSLSLLGFRRLEAAEPSRRLRA